MTESFIVIAFSKEVQTKEPGRKVGYDLNEKSMVGSDGTIYDLSEAARLHTLYGIRRSKFHRRHPFDRRLTKKFASTKREKERVDQLLHRISGRIVQKAEANGEAIILERLTGIRYARQTANGRRDRQAAQDRALALPPATIPHGLQGQVGGSASGVRFPGVYIEEM